MMHSILNVGVDVANATVVVACAAQRCPVQSIPHRRAALRAWLKSLPVGSRMGVASTGDYHAWLMNLAQAHGPTGFLLNPWETRHDAKAMGHRAKTDRVDAELIARLIAQEHTHWRAYIPPTANQRTLDRLIRRRATMVRLQGTLKLTMRHLGGFAAELKAVMDNVAAWLAKIDAARLALAARSPQHLAAQQRVETIVGVGPLVGISLTNPLERVPFHKADAVVAFLGWDPRANDSGQKAGRRRLSKRGPAELRRLLFNAAMSASTTKVWTPIDELHRAHGWSTTASLVIIARTIARAAWSIHHDRTTVNSERITNCLT